MYSIMIIPLFNLCLNMLKGAKTHLDAFKYRVKRAISMTIKY